MTSVRAPSVGILHPGSMGAAVAAQARRNGAEVLWCPAGRSRATKRRAEEAGLSAVSSVAEMTERCEIILSLCPPAHADEVAVQVAGAGFHGIYVEANAIAPSRVAVMCALVLGDAAAVVDGSVVGSPPSSTKTTRLYLSGPEEPTAQVAKLFAGSAVHVRTLAGGIGRASALKLAYSSYQKASRVLAAVAYGLAREFAVEEELLDIASLRTTNYLTETDYIPTTAARSWRWAPEMAEAADVLKEAALPADLVEAAGRIMQRWAGDKDRPMKLPEALDHLHSTVNPHPQ